MYLVFASKPNNSSPFPPSLIREGGWGVEFKVTKIVLITTIFSFLIPYKNILVRIKESKKLLTFTRMKDIF